jgi:hypothetical protein
VPVEQQPPEVLALLIADHVHRDDGTGKFFILGTRASIGAAAFPFNCPSLAVYAGLVDGRGETPVRLRLIDADEAREPVLEFETTVNLREPFSNSGMLPTPGKCRELAAEVDWEFHRAVGLLPPEEKKPMVAAGTIAVFLSYSHADEKLRKKLVNHLSQLRNEGLIRDWHDRVIGAGTEWEGQIQEHLNSAQIILLLVSSEFLASPYIRGVEVKRALERHEAGEARVIPVILRSCDWQSAPFGRLQALPTDGKPVTKW